ncbi:unnamed protein product, partial [Polarella glacialis]
MLQPYILARVVLGRHFDYVEIGTADFDTIAQQLANTHAVGLSVEPVEEHLRRLPSGPGYQQKVQAAVSEEDGWADLYVVRPEYMEPSCTSETLAGLGLPYCLPWWFRATASLNRPASLVEVHAGPKALEAQMTVKVQTLTYRSLLLLHNVTSIGILKIDTEGLDVQILRQALDHGAATGEFPERIQFEKNNLTDMSQAFSVYHALETMYDCWIPAAEDDVHCLRLRDLALGRPESTSGDSEEPLQPTWWRVELPGRVAVSAVRIHASPEDSRPGSWMMSVGNSPDPSENPACGRLAAELAPGSSWASACGAEGRFLALLAGRENSRQQPRPYRVEVLGAATPSGAWRASAGRECAATGRLFDGYDPACEARCREDEKCRFFTIYSSLWCATSASCDEDMPSSSSAITFSVQSSRSRPLRLGDARQSSEDWGGSPGRAIDGRLDPHFVAGSCSHTAGGDQESSPGAWWSA